MTPGPHLKLSTLRCLLANSVYSLEEENWREKVVCHLPREGSRPLDPGRDQKRKITGRIELGEERCDLQKVLTHRQPLSRIKKEKGIEGFKVDSYIN